MRERRKKIEIDLLWNLAGAWRLEDWLREATFQNFMNLSSVFELAKIRRHCATESEPFGLHWL